MCRFLQYKSVNVRPKLKHQKSEKIELFLAGSSLIVPPLPYWLAQGERSSGEEPVVVNVRFSHCENEYLSPEEIFMQSWYFPVFNRYESLSKGGHLSGWILIERGAINQTWLIQRPATVTSSGATPLKYPKNVNIFEYNNRFESSRTFRLGTGTKN